MQCLITFPGDAGALSHEPTTYSDLRPSFANHSVATTTQLWHERSRQGPTLRIFPVIDVLPLPRQSPFRRRITWFRQPKKSPSTMSSHPCMISPSEDKKVNYRLPNRPVF